MKLRGAIVGCGFISEFHLRGWRRIPEVAITALVDPDRTRAEDRRARFAPTARIYDHLEALLAAEPLDFVDLLTPPALHEAHCRRAASAGLHVICQKPLCERWEDAARLVADLATHPRQFLVHENHRFRPWFRHVLALGRERALGSWRQVALLQHDPSEPAEKINTEAERGVLLHYGVHLADMMIALLGDPLRVHARWARINPRVRGESAALAMFEYPETTVTLDIAWKSGGAEQGHALFIGEHGEACYEGCMTRAASARFRVFQDRATVRDEPRVPLDDYVESFFQFERAFVDAVLYGAPPPSSAADNLRSLRAIFAAYESARTGSVVNCAGYGRGP